MPSLLRPCLVSFALLTFVTGVAYPAAVTSAAHAIFPAKAGGSLVRREGTVVGSALLGQSFSDTRYFWGRPSATTPYACNAGGSAASNLGPSNPALRSAVRARADALRAADPGSTAAIPVDLVTTSASGLDPHVRPEAAYFQVHRVAKARGISEERVRALVDAHVEGPELGLFGEPRVEVLRLNLALDELR